MLRQAQHLVRPRLAGLALLAVAAVAAPAAVGAGSPTERAQVLRDRDRALAAQSRAAVLELYALETKLTRARARLGALERRAAAVRDERRAVARRLRVAQRGLRVTEERLAARLRALYEQGDVDPLALVLASQSIEAALSSLDSLGEIARGDQRVLAAVRKARDDLGALQARLAERERRVTALRASAAATARELAGARASRVAYVSALAQRRRLTGEAVERLEAQAHAARVKAQTLELPATAAPTSAPAPAAPYEAPSPATPPESGGRTLTVTATGYALPGRTATGLPVGWGVVAVDPSVIPLGTKMTVPGYGEAVAADIGGAVRGATIDLWFPSVAQAHAWGRRTVTITIH